MKHPLL